MTMNPNTTATELRRTTRRAKTAQATASAGGAAAKPLKRSLTPAALFGAAFILAVSLVAKVFYD